MKNRMIIIAIIFCLTSISALAQSNSSPITPNNAGQLMLIHTVNGNCASFDPNGTVIATTSGLYSLSSGVMQIDNTENPVDYPEWVSFSPDGKWLLMGASIYDVETGESVFSLTYAQAPVVFSENGQFIHIDGLTYDTETREIIENESIPDFEYFVFSSGERLVWRDITSGNGIPTYLSPRGKYWVHILEGIYDVNTGELLELPDELNNPSVLEAGSFSSGDSLFFVANNADETPIAYSLPDLVQIQFGENPFLNIAEQLAEPLSENAWVIAHSENNELIAVYPDGVFDLLSGDKRFDIDETVREMSFNEDSSLLFATTILPELWIYETETGAVLAKLPGSEALVSADQEFIAMTLPEQECTIYGITVDN